MDCFLPPTVTAGAAYRGMGLLAVDGWEVAPKLHRGSMGLGVWGNYRS